MTLCPIKGRFLKLRTHSNSVVLEFLSISHGIWFCIQLMLIGLHPVSWNLNRMYLYHWVLSCLKTRWQIRWLCYVVWRRYDNMLLKIKIRYLPLYQSFFLYFFFSFWTCFWFTTFSHNIKLYLPILNMVERMTGFITLGNEAVFYQTLHCISSIKLRA